MSHRIPLVATVIGALIVGGATTGITLALWRDQGTLDSSSVNAGELTVSVKNAPETSVTLGSISDLVPGGAPMAVEGMIRNTSPTAAKNLELNVKVSGLTVATDPAPSTGFTLANLKVDVRSKPTDDECPTLEANDLTEASATYSTDHLNAVALSDSNRTVPICVSIAATSAMPEGATGTLDLTFTGVQAE